MILNKRNIKPLIIPIILAGGSGESLWPLSRRSYPKSLLNLIGETSLLQNALQQIPKIISNFLPIIVGNIEYGSAIAAQLKKTNTEAILLLETQSHNTGAAIAIAAQYALKHAHDPLLLILPIDIYIDSADQFARMVSAATKVASKEKLVIFGIKPDRPATNYGYIQKGSSFAQSTGFVVDKFIEKPDLKKAIAYLKSGKYYWNSGIFLFQTSTFLAQLALHSPDILSESQKLLKKIDPKSKTVLIKTHLMRADSHPPIDKAVFEKTKLAIVFPFKGGWHDLGNWNGLYNISKKDKHGNAKTNNVANFDTKDCYLYSDKQLLVTLGINNLLVVVTKDAILVAARDKIQDIKKIVHYLIKKKYAEAILAPRIYQDWGCYEVVEKTKSQQVTHFFVNPKETFVHRIQDHCSAYWITISGKAKIQLGKKEILISKSKPAQFAAGSELMLNNTGNIQLHFIEICG